MTEKRIHFPLGITSELKLLSKIEEDNLMVLIDSFDDMKYKISCTEFLDAALEKIDIGESECDRIFHFLTYLVRKYLKSELDEDTYLSKFNEFVNTQAKIEEGINPERIKNFLKSSLSSDSIKIISKSEDIINSNPKTYLSKSAQIITDIRPILTIGDIKQYDDPEKNFNFASIIHNLKFTFGGENRELQDFYVSLGSSDLYEFYTVIKRAIRKDELFQNFLNKLDINRIE